MTAFLSDIMTIFDSDYLLNFWLSAFFNNGSFRLKNAGLVLGPYITNLVPTAVLEHMLGLLFNLQVLSCSFFFNFALRKR